MPLFDKVSIERVRFYACVSNGTDDAVDTATARNQRGSPLLVAAWEVVCLLLTGHAPADRVRPIHFAGARQGGFLYPSAVSSRHVA